MPRKSILCWAAAAALVAPIVAGPPAGGQETVSAAALMEMEPSMKLTCEVSCSETKLRTAVARLTWTGPGTLQGQTLVPGADAAVQGERIDASVYADGFASDHYASFPTVATDAEMAPQGLAAAQAETLPAYNLSIVDVDRDSSADAELMGLTAATDAGEMKVSTVVVEGLEPGLNYTWRLVVETADGFEVSDTVICQAPVCTADMLLLEEKEDQP
jgi:hypothetical protein